MLLGSGALLVLVGHVDNGAAEDSRRAGRASAQDYAGADCQRQRTPRAASPHRERPAAQHRRKALSARKQVSSGEDDEADHAQRCTCAHAIYKWCCGSWSGR